MNFSKIEITGLRGFATKQTLNFAIPNGKVGSGLTVIVGPNNSGKSTVTEAINAFTTNEPPSFTEGKRNINSDNGIEITIFNTEGQNLILKSINSNSSETTFDSSNGLLTQQINPFIIPSRRMFNPLFGKGLRNRQEQILNSQLPAQRSRGYDLFYTRLFKIEKDPITFNEVLKKILGTCPDWSIDQYDDGQYYLKFTYNNSKHSSDGAGEGLLSIFIIADSLYDSSPNDLIVIDEPELSVHPSLQKRLMNILLEYSKDRQIVISTHSQYFISWQAILNGGEIARVIKEVNTSSIYQLSRDVVGLIGESVGGVNFPHLFGLTANEIFFLNENVVLVEGQEDVVIYRKILSDLNLDLDGDFYGWGVGGAENMKNIARILKSIGFKKVYGILDGDKEYLLEPLKQQFPDYSFSVIPAKDVRDKAVRPATVAVSGITQSNGTIKQEYTESITQLFLGVNAFFKLPNE